MSLRLAAFIAPIVVAVLLLACGGGGGERPLREEESAPTPTRTAPIFQRSPIAGSPSPGSPTPTSTPAAEGTPVVRVAVTPVAEPFEVTVDEAVNVRDRPSTSEATTIVGGIFPGQKATVLGEARGEEVETGKGDLWYQVEFTQNGATVQGFVYAPLVEKVEE